MSHREYSVICYRFHTNYSTSQIHTIRPSIVNSKSVLYVRVQHTFKNSTIHPSVVYSQINTIRPSIVNLQKTILYVRVQYKIKNHTISPSIVFSQKSALYVRIQCILSKIHIVQSSAMYHFISILYD